MRYAKAISAFLMFLPLARPAYAQDGPRTERVAGVVAVVGDSVITSAFLGEAFLRRMSELQQAQRPVPTTAEAVKAMQDTLLNERVDELVILQTIARDTTYRVNDAAVAAEVDSTLTRTQRNVGGPARFQQALRESGLTLQDYRNILTSQVRTQQLFEQFRQNMRQTRQAPKATEREIQDFFPVFVAGRPPRPASISFQQIVVKAQASDTADARAKAKADSIYQMLFKDRKQFGDLARRFSDDEGTREKGGEFGWFTEAMVVKEFGRAAFSAPAGTLLPPVRSQFGYHVIEVQRRRGSEAQARHILIAPTITPADAERARARADSAAAALTAGGNIQDLVRRFGDPTEDVDVFQADPAAVGTAYGLDLSTASKGSIVGPGTGAPGGQAFAILRVTDVSAAGPYKLSDPGVRDAVRRVLENQKLLDEAVRELRQKTHIEIRDH